MDLRPDAENVTRAVSVHVLYTTYGCPSLDDESVSVNDQVEVYWWNECTSVQC